MSLLDNLPHRCTTQRRTTVEDDLGGNREIRTVLQTNFPCWVQQASATESQDYAKKGQTVTQKVFFDCDPQLVERDEIVITEIMGRPIPPAAQVILEISTKPLPDATAGLGLLYKYFVMERTGQK